MLNIVELINDFTGTHNKNTSQVIQNILSYHENQKKIVKGKRFIQKSTQTESAMEMTESSTSYDSYESDLSSVSFELCDATTSRKRRILISDSPLKKKKRCILKVNQKDKTPETTVKTESTKDNLGHIYHPFVGFNDGDFHVIDPSDIAWSISDDKIIKNEFLTDLQLMEKEIEMVRKAHYRQ